eukprot:356095-Chlamydomonas_euryale.AAC.2
MSAGHQQHGRRRGHCMARPSRPAAISNTGVAENIAWLFIQPSIAIGGEAALLSSLYVITALLSEILTNNAAAALMYPIAQIAGEALGESHTILAGGRPPVLWAGFAWPELLTSGSVVTPGGHARWSPQVVTPGRHPRWSPQVVTPGGHPRSSPKVVTPPPMSSRQNLDPPQEDLNLDVHDFETEVHTHSPHTHAFTPGTMWVSASI